MKEFKVFLREDEIPNNGIYPGRFAHSLQPPLHPGTGKPIGPEDLAAVFPMNLIEQEVSTQRWIDIPKRSWKSFSSGGRRRSTVPMPLRRPSEHPRESTTK